MIPWFSALVPEQFREAWFFFQTAPVGYGPIWFLPACPQPEAVPCSECYGVRRIEVSAVPCRSFPITRNIPKKRLKGPLHHQTAQKERSGLDSLAQIFRAIQELHIMSCKLKMHLSNTNPTKISLSFRSSGNAFKVCCNPLEVVSLSPIMNKSLEDL